MVTRASHHKRRRPGAFGVLSSSFWCPQSFSTIFVANTSSATMPPDPACTGKCKLSEGCPTQLFEPTHQPLHIEFAEALFKQRCATHVHPCDKWDRQRAEAYNPPRQDLNASLHLSCTDRWPCARTSYLFATPALLIISICEKSPLPCAQTLNSTHFLCFSSCWLSLLFPNCEMVILSLAVDSVAFATQTDCDHYHCIRFACAPLRRRVASSTCL